MSGSVVITTDIVLGFWCWSVFTSTRCRHYSCRPFTFKNSPVRWNSGLLRSFQEEELKKISCGTSTILAFGVKGFSLLSLTSALTSPDTSIGELLQLTDVSGNDLTSLWNEPSDVTSKSLEFLLAKLDLKMFQTTLLCYISIFSI